MYVRKVFSHLYGTSVNRAPLHMVPQCLESAIWTPKILSSFPTHGTG